MAATGQVVINIIGDASKLKAALGESATGLEGFSKKMQNVGKAAVSLGSKMTIGITAPLVLLGKTAFDAARDLTESINKVDVVFADSAKNIQKWARDAASAFGMSRQEALEAAGTFGNLFRSLGLDIPVATKMSKSLVELAADLASFNNADPEEVLLALRSGLVGEIEPLRKFGVSLSQARVEAKAMEMGLYDGNGAISAAAKAQAAYAIILEDTTLAQGDFARTADSAANKQRILKAQFEDTAAKLGQALIPIMQSLMEVAMRVADWFSQLSPRMQKIVVIIGLALAVLPPLVTVFGALATVIGLLLTPVGLVVVAVAAVVAAVVIMWLKWDEIWNFMKDHPAIALVVSILAAPVAALFLIVGAIKFLYENWDSIWNAIQNITESVWSRIRPIFDAEVFLLHAIIDAVNWLGNAASGAFNAFAAAILRFWNLVDGPLNALLNILQKIVSVADKAGSVVGKAIDLANPTDEIGGAISGVFDGVHLASGGIVTRPTLAMVGEGGEPEAVIPLSKIGSVGGITVNIHAPERDPGNLGIEIGRRLRAEMFLAGR